MSLRIEWIAFAEGSVIDTRQVLSLIGVNQNSFPVDVFPAVISTSVAILISEDPDAGNLDQENLEGRVSLTIRDSGGQTLSSESTAVNGERKYPDVPASFSMAAVVNLEVEQLGKYSVEVKLETPGKEPEKRVKYLYVIEPA
jgi:hypothetical protein